MTIEECAAYLAARDDFLIVSHIRPDGDTLCSGAALCSALRRAGKTAYVYPNPELIDRYRSFITPWQAPAGFVPRVVVTADIADTQLIPPAVTRPIDLVIDHHPSNTHFGANCLVQPERSSCGELVLDVIRALGGGVTQPEADLLYIAVSTDTGCFMYANTNAGTFRAAAALLELGACSRDLNTLFFRTISRARMALEGMIYSGLRYFRDGQVTAALVTLDMMAKSGATENDSEDLAGLAGKAEGSLLGITIRETAPGRCKISLRSHPEINCTEICAMFGGGGHAMAAGCTVDLPPEQALQSILKAVDEKWPRS